MKKLGFLVLFLFSITLIANENTCDNILSKPDHALWSILLKKHVDVNGNVDYKAFKKDNATLEVYLNLLATSSPTNEWSKNEKLAYYINLYNAATVKLILEYYPLNSIKDIKNPWDKEWIKVGSETLSLGDIEHKILRKMGEPRIHFAINCASYSCPKLANKPYLPNTLELQLQKATFDFINDNSKNKISKDVVQLSNIFKWFKGDFTKNSSLVTYLQAYINFTLSTKAKINYIDYDWSLNETK